MSKNEETIQEVRDWLSYNLGYLAAVLYQAEKGENWDDSDRVEIPLFKIHDLVTTLKKAENKLKEYDEYLDSML